MIGIVSVKGGCGASLVATNLGVALAEQARCVLLDLHAATGVDDLLLGLKPTRSWADLIPVAGEITPHHFELTICAQPSGVNLLAAPAEWVARESGLAAALTRALVGQFPWVLVDGESGRLADLDACDLILLVSTCDPPALRAARRLTAPASRTPGRASGLVLNQVGRGQPASPQAIAASLGLPLLAALPPDPRAVGYQVHLGHPCARDARSTFGRGIRRLAGRLISLSQAAPAARLGTVSSPDGGTA